MDMTKYWIREHDNQIGPFTIDELQGRTFAPNSTFVWYKGLDGWTHIENVPELASFIATEPVAVEEPEIEPMEAEVEEPVEVEEPAEMETEAEAEAETETEAEVEASASAPTPPVFNPMPTPPVYQAPQQNPSVQEEKPKCPPTNLVAAIVCTMLCCTPLGVAGIVFAIFTKNKYNEGNYEKALTYSQWSDWMCILSVVLFFLSLPFTIFFL